MKTVSDALFAAIIGSAFVQPVPAAEAGKSKETVLHSFGSGTDGQYPDAGPIAVKGTLYGVTEIGGSDGLGTVFSVNPNTGAETVLHSFGSGTDGSSPQASLIDVNGMLYGTTAAGGTYGDGTVFSVNPNTGAETVIYSFQGGTDGDMPIAYLTDVKGMLYGTTAVGGTYGDGTVFTVSPNTGAETVLHSFGSGTDGQTSLIDLKSTLYGTTTHGGADYTGCYGYGCGTAFALKRP